MADFDVFLCHNSEDKPEVKKIGLQLKALGVMPWLDEWNLRPGLSWQDELERQIKRIRAAAVFVGKAGIGPWQKKEINAYIRKFIHRECPVIPIILPGCTQVPRLPVFLEDLTWVDFRKKDPDPMRLLVWGITGKDNL